MIGPHSPEGPEHQDLVANRCLEVLGVPQNSVSKTFQNPFQKGLFEKENAAKILS